MEEPNYIKAQGIEEFKAVLEELLTKCKANSSFAQQAHYIRYELGQQQSLVKVDMSERPYKFWYYDRQGRPATIPVKEAIAKFLWEKCGEREIYLNKHAGQFNNKDI